jgi:hypothetical protein
MSSQINANLINITRWCDGKDWAKIAIARYVTEAFGIKGFEGLHQLHNDKDGQWTPEPEGGWSTKQKDMTAQLVDQKAKVYDTVWEAVEAKEIKPATGEGEDAPPPEQPEPSVDPLDLMEEEDVQEDVQEEEVKMQADDKYEDASDYIEANRPEGVTETIVEETSFLDLDSDLKTEVAVEKEQKKKAKAKPVSGSLDEMVRAIIREELADITPQIDEDSLKKLIKKTLKEAF